MEKIANHTNPAYLNQPNNRIGLMSEQMHFANPDQIIDQSDRKESHHKRINKLHVAMASVAAGLTIFVGGNMGVGAVKGAAQGGHEAISTLVSGSKNLTDQALGFVDPVQNAKNHGDNFVDFTIRNSGETPETLASEIAKQANLSYDDTLSAIDTENGVAAEQIFPAGDTIKIPVHYNK